MPAKDPFAGIRLSEQTTPPKLEQRLFTSEPPKPAPAARPEAPAQPQASKAPAPSSPAAPKPVTPQLAPASLTRRFDLKDLPLYKASYLFTMEELEALEDLKLELRRDLDTKTTKNDLIRAALHMLVEDYRLNRARSYVIRKARRP